MPIYIGTDLLKCAALAADKDAFTFDEVIALIDAVKPADVQEVKRGYWVNSADGTKCKLDEHGEMSPRYCGYIDPMCSICGEYLTAAGEYSMPGRYCPNCGAKMDGEKENEE